jgi:hypothetical protein
MKPSPQITTDLFNQQLDREYSEQLSSMVILAEVVGLALIALGMVVLKDLPWRPHMLLTWWFVGLGLAALLAYRFYIWHDDVRAKLAKQFNWQTPAPMAEAFRKTKILRATLLLILLDSIILSILIPLTGGPGKSVLDPLVPTIPIIAVILRQPKRTVYWAFSSGIFLVLLAIVQWWFGHAPEMKEPVTIGVVSFTHRDPRHPLSFCIVTGGALALSVLELTSYNKSEIGKDVGNSIARLVDQDPRLKGIDWPIWRGSKRWIKWLAHRDLPLVDLSLVHPPEDILRQAVVLAAPYWLADGDWKYKMFTRRRITRHITFLTFAAHWIDDHFDALERYCQSEELRRTIRNSTPDGILNTHNPRLDELLHRMKQAVLPRFMAPLWLIYRLLHMEKREERLLPARVKMVRRAVERIIYGGLIQNAQCKPRLDQLIEQYHRFVQEGLSEDLISVYSDIYNSDCRLAAWTTAKVVMELFDATTPAFSQDESEFFSLLYAPLLYYHDYKNEAAEERFGEAFSKANLPDTSHMVSIIDRCFVSMPKLLGSNKLNEGRLLQLNLLLSIYGDKEKAVKDAYQKFFNKATQR